ncbi:hypothetical protein JHK86_043527 [Glycine max]|nr:hypothetical protein JHK86_043527 [Glycine max]
MLELQRFCSLLGRFHDVLNCLLVVRCNTDEQGWFDGTVEGGDGTSEIPNNLGSQVHKGDENERPNKISILIGNLKGW